MRQPIVPDDHCASPPVEVEVERILGTSGEIRSDIACRKCSYNLRGLNVQGRCPECGAAIGLSVHGDLLRFADPRWLDTLRLGVRWIVVAVGVGITAVMVAVILGTAAGVQMVLGIAMLAAIALAMLGMWLLTSPDPSGIGEDRYGLSRKIIRLALVAAIVQNAMQWVHEAISPPLEIVFQIVVFLLGAVVLVGLFAQLQYLKKLAKRIPDEWISRWAGFLMYAIGAVYGLLILIASLTFIPSRWMSFAYLKFANGIGVALALVLLILGIMYLLVLEKFGRRVKEQAQFALQTWAAAGPT